jgi:GxxExxY protein
MPKAQAMYRHQELTRSIIGVFYDVYNELGFGFLESVYDKALTVALGQAGLQVNAQMPVAVWFRGHEVGAFRADLVVEDTVLVELKATAELDRVHETQLLNLLKSTNIEVGLLLNFGRRPRIKRFVFTKKQKRICAHLRESVAKPK